MILRTISQIKAAPPILSLVRSNPPSRQDSPLEGRGVVLEHLGGSRLAAGHGRGIRAGEFGDSESGLHDPMAK